MRKVRVQNEVFIKWRERRDNIKTGDTPILYYHFNLIFYVKIKITQINK